MVQNYLKTGLLTTRQLKDHLNTIISWTVCYIHFFIYYLAKRVNFFAARAMAENSESKVETFNIDDDEGDADAVTVSDPEPSTSAGFPRCSANLNNEHLNNGNIWIANFYLSGLQISVIQMVVKCSNGGLDARLNLVRYSFGFRISDHSALGQLLTIWIWD